VRGARAIGDLFADNDSGALRGFIVWIPMVGTDAAPAADAEAARFADARVTHAWDPERRAGRLFKEPLGLWRTAWDVYLVYAPGESWSGESPPAPTLWMHQLGSDPGAPRDRFLDASRLSADVRRALEAAHAPTF
jgi:hypothetical protein